VSSTSSGQINLSAVSVATSTTTYTFSPITPTNLQVGSTVVITGLGDVTVQGNGGPTTVSVNGLFAVSGVSGNTFTVNNSLVGANSIQNPKSVSETGNGTVLGVGNPVFLVPGP
jgi:hypothetical protein